ncbi:MAG: universal stress protein [Gammaproteobacteria bacterium]|nr:universal stress protein [Gammaproteobacteria bacterium]
MGSDGSEFSEGAVREAIAWARRHGCRLVAVCTAQVGLGQLEYAPEVVESLDRAAREACEAVGRRAAAEGVVCETVVHESEEPHRHIVAAAERHGAQAIVVGRRGRRGLTKMLMGSVTALTIGHAPCGVFVVPRAGRLLGRRVLVATDGSAHSEKTAREAIALAKRTGGTIVACAIAHGRVDTQMAQAYVDQVKALADAEGVAVEAVTGEGTPYVEILEAARAQDADLVAIGSHGHTGLFQLMMGSVADRVIRLTDRSVMVVR